MQQRVEFTDDLFGQLHHAGDDDDEGNGAQILGAQRFERGDIVTALRKGRVPQAATAVVTPAACRAMTSVYPSTTTA